MSELGEAIKGILTSEWQSTPEIVAKCPSKGHTSANTFRSHVYHHLCRLVRAGEAETRIVEYELPHASVVRQWRLIP